MDNLRDGIMSHSEAVGEGVVAVPCSVVAECDGQLQIRFQTFPKPAVLLRYVITDSLQQLLEPGWFHPDKVPEPCHIFPHQCHIVVS